MTMNGQNPALGLELQQELLKPRPPCVLLQGPTPAALQEMLDNIDKYTEQVLSQCLGMLLAEQMGDTGGLHCW